MQQQQQHLILQQHQPMMSSSAYYPNNITTDHIQQYLDENKSLILKIVESQNSGKMSECAESQARLQQNLMYLAAIADSQPQPPSLQPEYAPSGVMLQGSSLYIQHSQGQQMPLQSVMAAHSSISVHNQLSMNSEFHMLQGNATAYHRYLDFGRESSGGGGGEGLLGCAASGSGDVQEKQQSGGSRDSNGN